MKRVARKEKHSQPHRSKALEAGAPRPKKQLTLEADIGELRTVIGNRGMERLLARGRIHRQTGVLQRNPVPDASAPAAAPEAPAPAATPEAPAAGEQRPAVEVPPVTEPEEIVFEEGSYIGDAEFYARALPKNKYYAERPPQAGWPYSPELKALWEQGNYDEFAGQVASIQYFRFKLADDKVDGVLGPMTAKALLKYQAPETPPTSPTEPEPDDPALKNHPAAIRILTPVQQAFGDHKEAEKEYNAAHRELEKAKKADKASKEAQRQTALTTMEEKRASARAAMAAARQAVAGLTASEFAGAEGELKRVRGFINRELNVNTIYYAQGFNANILFSSEKTAAARTCNMTVISMMLEALGKSTKDYVGDDLSATAAQFAEQLGVYNARPEDLTSLRMPDFLQLVAIDEAGGRKEAAGKITAHSFIIAVAIRFGLKLSKVKGGQVVARGEEEDYFLSTKYTSNLDIIGALYRPSYNEAAKEINKDETYKSLKGSEREAYKQKYIQDYTEERRKKYLGNVTQWIEIDTFAQDELNTLQTELNAPSLADPTKAKSFAEVRVRVDETIAALREYETSIPKELSGKSKEFKKIIAVLEKPRNRGASKPDAHPKDLKNLFDEKGKDDPLKGLRSNLEKYKNLKTIYEKLVKEEGLEELVPVDDYKASIIPTMQMAIDSGNQVMVNLDNHFVRLQSADEEGIIIDDPGNRWGENTRIIWEQARKSGYFQHYLMLSP